ncbi:FAD-dependent oxidoreductase [Echinicola jeungdonensis]|uniref:L-aspartate oxidase n=1 Tax=Echinicola jeungdonensis TaxID=709343 RepID=A0ABV5J4K5_9BACT|nr:FAD-dependent oxidoreductase [Echinicola jeungdonensis]MDN3670680.1 FAD-dependent oxidoreductase [Echinicola jeungdonensis]
METDVLIIGSGVSGLSCALNLVKKDPNCKVIILDKSLEGECNTRHAQGGLAAVMDPSRDDFFFHYQDTMEAGRYKSFPHVVKYLVENAPSGIQDLSNWGVGFDRDSKGGLVLGLEGGHSQPRIVHYKDCTGSEIHQKLLLQIKQHPNIHLLKGTFTIDLITNDLEEKANQKVCFGAWGVDLTKNEVFRIFSGATVLATGGTGWMFEKTTNPSIATGDGLAMAIRAGARTRDLNHYQFHPTAIHQKKNDRALLITEALRGAGAHIVNYQLERFLFNGDSRGELATRDVVTHLIQEEMQKSGMPNVYLDARHLGKEKLESRFPQVVLNCSQIGLHPAEDLIPIAPAAHYQCGGISVDLNGLSSIAQLYALGECAGTGLHGANRLASNSLIEGVVFAKNVALTILSAQNQTQIIGPTQKENNQIQGKLDRRECPVGIDNLLNQLKTEMSAIMLRSENYQRGVLGAKIMEWKKLVDNAFQKNKFNQKILEIRNLLDVAEKVIDFPLNKNMDVEYHENFQV